MDDLDSRNGVFVRQAEFPLFPGNEFLMGGTKILVHGDHQLNLKLSEPSPFLSAYSFILGEQRFRLVFFDRN